MDLSQVLAALVPLSFVVYWTVDLLKDITNGDRNAILTKVGALVFADVIFTLYAHGGLDVGGSLKYVSNVPWQGILLAAWVLAASGGTLSDVLRTFNRNDPTVKSKLLPKA